MATAPRDTRELIAKAAGGAAGIGALLAAGVHQGMGGPEVEETLVAAQGQVPAAFLAQIEAAWLGATVMFVLIGGGLLAAAFRYRGWLVSLGRLAAVWFAAVGLAFVWAGPRWGDDALSPQFVLLFVLAALAAVASTFAGPRT